MAAHVLIALLAIQFVYSLWYHHAIKHECRYCGERWGRHDVHCPYKDIK